MKRKLFSGDFYMFLTQKKVTILIHSWYSTLGPQISKLAQSWSMKSKFFSAVFCIFLRPEKSNNFGPKLLPDIWSTNVQISPVQKIIIFCTILVQKKVLQFWSLVLNQKVTSTPDFGPESNKNFDLKLVLSLGLKISKSAWSRSCNF